jgi:hypothetical protein
LKARECVVEGLSGELFQRGEGWEVSRSSMNFVRGLFTVRLAARAFAVEAEGERRR